jgi:hypothetical protein
MADLSKPPFTAIERVLSEIPDKTHARQRLRYALYKTREHEKVELGAGAIVGLVIAIVFGGGAWAKTSLLGVLGFLATVVLIFMWHWIHAPSVFHDHWEATTKELLHKTHSENLVQQKRQFLAERLQSLLNEAGTVEYGAVSMNSIEGMGKVWRATAYHERVKNFVKQHWGAETASRYDKEKSDLLEELLADCFREKDDTKPDISGAIEVVIQKKLLPERGQGIAGFDYYFTLRCWLRNIGAPGNFQNFSLYIFVDNKTYAGERLPVAGYCLFKQVPTQSGAHTTLQVTPEKLEEFDAFSILERNSTRYGWLRFVIRNVEWNQRDESANYISHLELTVRDGSGGQTTITDKSTSWKYENPPNFEVRICPAEWKQLGPSKVEGITRNSNNN